VIKFIVALLAVGIGFFGFQVFRFMSAGPGRASEAVIFEVPPGRSFHSVALSLQTQGLVSNELYLRILAKLTHQGSKVKVGEYALNRGMTPQEILSTLVSGKSILYPITVPEGTNIFELATILQNSKLYKNEEFLKMARDPAMIRELLGIDVSSLEGYLFPETYNVTKFTPLKELLASMVQNFKTNYSNLEAGLKAKGQAAPLPRHELVILASMVEKETGNPADRPTIASVFYNRLAKGMKLQSDPTILYGIWTETGAYKNNITKEDILRPTRYNTYTVARLPFGPISNPGRESLAAVMKPANTEYFYFVSHNNGTTGFSKSYEDHSRAVKDFQVNPEKRIGKSWRDLKKQAVTR
jgi:UPF0755 protein